MQTYIRICLWFNDDNRQCPKLSFEPSCTKCLTSTVEYEIYLSHLSRSVKIFPISDVLFSKWRSITIITKAAFFIRHPKENLKDRRTQSSRKKLKALANCYTKRTHITNLVKIFAKIWTLSRIWAKKLSRFTRNCKVFFTSIPPSKSLKTQRKHSRFWQNKTRSLPTMGQIKRLH